MTTDVPWVNLKGRWYNMALSMYVASVTLFRQRVAALAKVLDKGAAFAAERGIDPTTLLESRLAPDMMPLTRQVQLVTDHAVGCPARLAGIESPVFPDTEKTFAELDARLTRGLAFLDTLRPEQIDGTEEKEIVLKLLREYRFTGQQYLIGFVVPNLIFHCTTAYDLLRHAGVPLGKRDFIGAI